MKTTTGVFFTSIKTGVGFVGALRCYENGRFLWQTRCPVVRLTESDALKDARIEMFDYLGQQFVEVQK